jgi:hypothetical protein
VPCDLTGGHYFVARNHVGARRGISLAKAVSVAIGATILPSIGTPIIARAATIEEVARCRAIQINKERWDCFKALKAPRQNAPKATRDDTPPSQTEDVPQAEAGGRSENGGNSKDENGGSSEDEKRKRSTGRPPRCAGTGVG